MGGYWLYRRRGNFTGGLRSRIELAITPDLYVNWELNKPHQILWSTFGNDGGGRGLRSICIRM